MSSLCGDDTSGSVFEVAPVACFVSVKSLLRSPRFSDFTRRARPDSPSLGLFDDARESFLDFFSSSSSSTQDFSKITKRWRTLRRAAAAG